MFLPSPPLRRRLRSAVGVGGLQKMSAMGKQFFKKYVVIRRNWLLNFEILGKNAPTDVCSRETFF